MSKWGNIVKGWNIVILSVIVSIFFFHNREVCAEEMIEEEITDKVILEEMIDLTKDEELDDTLELLNEEIIENLEESKVDEEEVFESESIIVDFDKEAIFTDYSYHMFFENDIVTIQRDLEQELNVLSILNSIDVEGLKNTYGVEKIGVTNQDDIWLEDVDVVTNGCHLVLIGSNFVSRYEIIVLGDINKDNNLTKEDIEVGIDMFLENTIEDNEEATLTEEVSYIEAVLKNNTYEVEMPVEEELVGNFINVNDTDLYVGEKVIVQYQINGFNYNYFNAISGVIRYNQEILLLESVSILSTDGEVIGGYLSNQFIYVLDNYRSGEYFLVMTFQCIQNGVTDISLENLKVVMNGYLLEIEDSGNLEVVVLKYGKGGDVENSINNNVSSGEKQSVVESMEMAKNPVLLRPNYSKQESSQIVTIVNLSQDNYIKNLEIEGYSIDFDKDVFRYLIEVGEDVSEVNLNVLLNNSSSSYFITGNENFKEGKNEIILTVFAENGSTRDYVIEVNKNMSNNEEGEVFEQDGEKELKRITLLIILGILVVTIIWIIYRLFQEED